MTQLSARDMKCDESRLAASAYIDRAITPEESARFQAHISICGDCHDYLSELQQLSLILKTAQRAGAPPEMRGHILSLIAVESAAPSVLARAAKSG